MIAQVLIELLPTSSGGLKKSQASGTRSLLYKFEVGGEPIAFGGFLDLDDSAMITPGLGPVHGTITFWAQEARALKAGDRFEIVYPIKPVGHGHIESI